MIRVMFAALDVLLVLGLTLRFTRLVIVDDLGMWWFRDPIFHWLFKAGEQTNMTWRVKLYEGITCPFCIGFWIGCVALASLAVFGGPGDVWEPWRWVAGAFTLNWVAAHLGARLGDAGYAEDDD